jgi:hypothetical protein
MIPQSNGEQSHSGSLIIIHLNNGKTIMELDREWMA